MMWLESIRLRNWKSYEEADFEFPPVTEKKNVILIGGRNGYGKTSLLEAMVLGIFGNEGFSTLQRALGSSAKDSSNGDALSYYNGFLARAFNKRALRRGRPLQASIHMVFQETEVGRCEIERIWHFDSNGRYRPNEEEVRIWTGPDREPLLTPPDEDEADYRRFFISRNLLPQSLAEFFLFDGMRVQKLADREMSYQVRQGIEGILGVPVLRELSGDLKGLSTRIRRDLAQAGGEQLQTLESEVAELEQRYQKLNAEKEEIEHVLRPLRLKKDELVLKVEQLGGAGGADLRKLYEQREVSQRAKDHLWDQLRGLIATEFSLAIVGSSLRSKTITALTAEGVRESWLQGREAGEQRLLRFLSVMDGRLEQIVKPSLTDSQKTGVETAAKDAWTAQWHPEPQGCAAEFRHAYLKGDDRAAVKAKLEAAGRVSVSKIELLLRGIQDKDKEINRLNRQIAEAQGGAEDARSIADELEKVAAEVGGREQRLRDIDNELERGVGELAAKRGELGRLRSTLTKDEPRRRTTEKAEAMLEVIEEIINKAVPAQIKETADQMTDAYREMAHKDIVSRIEIGKDCAVQLLDEEGNDIFKQDPSAGEATVFALSLIAAIRLVSGRCFPIVMDTPIANLDDLHRDKVLKYFSTLPGQIILLPQPEEVRGPYLDQLRSRLSKTYHLSFQRKEKIGISTVKEGYFPGMGA